MPEPTEAIVPQASPRERIEEAIDRAAEVFESPGYLAWARSTARSAADAATMAEEVWPGITARQSEALYREWLDEGRRTMLLNDIVKHAAAGAALAARESAIALDEVARGVNAVYRQAMAGALAELAKVFAGLAKALRERQR